MNLLRAKSFQVLAVFAALSVATIPFDMLISFFFLPFGWMLPNIAFLIMIFDALGGRIARAWIMAPIAWFGGYLALFGASVVEVKSIDNALLKDNADKRLAFDPTAQDLVMGADNCSNSLVSDLMTRFRLDEAFVLCGGDQRDYQRYRIADQSVCSALKGRTKSASIGTVGSGRTCILSTSERPTRPTIVINEKSREVRAPTLSAQAKLTTLSFSNGQEEISATAGRAAPMSPVPMLFAGCAMRACSFGFAHIYTIWPPVGVPDSGLDDDPEVSLAAQILALSPRSAAANQIADKAQPAEQPSASPRRISADDHDFKSLVSAAQNDRRDSLRAFVAGERWIIDHETRQWAQRSPDALIDHGEPLARRLGESLDRGEASRERSRQIQSLLATAPEDEFRKAAPALAAVFRTRPRLDPDLIGGGAMARLGTLDDPPFDVLALHAFREDAEPSFEALIAFCRAAPASSIYSERIGELIKRKSPPRVRTAGVAALYQMNREDLIAAAREDFERRDPKRAKERRRDFARPKEPCDNGYSLPIGPYQN